MDQQDRIHAMENELDRLLSWISHADSKIGTVFAIDTAMLGVMGVLVPSPQAWTIITAVFYTLATLFLLASLLFLSLAAFPRTKGPKNSLLYFGSIAGREFESYSKEINNLDEQSYLSDLIQQCHRNSQIATRKVTCIQRSMILLYIATPCWILSVYLLYLFRN